MEVVEFACGIPHAAQGRVLRPGLHRRRRCTRSASRSASAPGSRRSTSRPWCRCGCTRSRSRPGNTFVLKPSERDPSASQLRRRAVRRGRAARRRVQRGARRQGGRRRAARPPRRRRGLVRRLDADRQVHPRDGRWRTASACRRSAARRTTPSCCPTPTSTSPPTTSSPPATARPGSAAWRSRPPSPSGDAADALVAAAVGEGRARSRSARAATPTPRWARSSPPAARDRIVGYIGTGAEQGADARRRRPRARPSTGTRTASSSARRCSTTSRTDMDIYTRRDLRPGAVGASAWTPSTRPSS